MKTVSHLMYRIRPFSEAEVKKFSWRDLAVRHAEWCENAEFWTKAVAERKERNTKLKRPRYQDLINRQTMLSVARHRERSLREEIAQRKNDEWMAAFLGAKRRPESDGENVVHLIPPE